MATAEWVPPRYLSVPGTTREERAEGHWRVTLDDGSIEEVILSTASRTPRAQQRAVAIDLARRRRDADAELSADWVGEAQATLLPPDLDPRPQARALEREVRRTPPSITTRPRTPSPTFRTTGAPAPILTQITTPLPPAPEFGRGPRREAHPSFIARALSRWPALGEMIRFIQEQGVTVSKLPHDDWLGTPYGDYTYLQPPQRSVEEIRINLEKESPKGGPAATLIHEWAHREHAREGARERRRGPLAEITRQYWLRWEELPPSRRGFLRALQEVVAEHTTTRLLAGLRSRAEVKESGRYIRTNLEEAARLARRHPEDSDFIRAVLKDLPRFSKEIEQHLEGWLTTDPAWGELPF